MFCPQCKEKIPDNSRFCLFCGASITAAGEAAAGAARPEASALPKRTCAVCGRELPESSVSDVCVTCLYNRNYVAEPVDLPSEDSDFILPTFDDEDEEEMDLPIPPPSKKAAPPPREPRPPKGPRKPSGKFPVRVLLFPAILLLVLVAAIVLLLRFCGGNKGEKPGGEAAEPTPSASQSSSEDEKLQLQKDLAVSAAQAMVKKEAYSPSSVHYDAKTLSVKKKGEEFTVTQRFERQTSTGDIVQSDYIAVLRLTGSGENDYEAVMLQVDDKILYDHTADAASS